MEMKTITGLLVAGMLLMSCSDEELSDAYGQFEADEIVVSSESSGRILSFELDEGDQPEAGMIAALIDTTQLALQKKELEASAASVRTNISKLDAQKEVYQSQLETAEKELARVESLRVENAATQQQLDNSTGQVNTLNRQIAAVEVEKQSIYAELETLQVRMEQVDDQIRRSKIINPINGSVLSTYAEIHELMSPGKPLYRIANMDEMILRVFVSGAQLPRVRLGEEVEVWIDRNEKENERLSGTVSWVASRAEFTPRMIQTKEERVTQVYAVKVRVDNPDGKIKIGMPGEVKF